MKDLKDIQLEYLQQPFLQEDLAATPYLQLNSWFEELEQAEVSYRNAAVLSTVSENQQPTSRTVLVKEFSEEGLLVFTDYSSNKAADLARNPRAALLFFWKELERQVRIEGHAIKTSREVSENYFSSRPRESQFSAMASSQSSPCKLADLQERVKALKASGKDPVCPDDWGGYIIRFEKVEFWQGRPNRLHDRFVYEREGDGWKTTRLSP